MNITLKTLIVGVLISSLVSCTPCPPLKNQIILEVPEELMVPPADPKLL